MQIQSLIVFTVQIVFFAIQICDSRRAYTIDKRLQETRYDGKVMSYSHALNGLKLLTSSARNLSPSNGAENSTLEDAFSELMFDAITNKLKDRIKTGVDSEIERKAPLDPLKLERIHLTPTIGGHPFDITLKNLRVRGLSSFTLRDLTPKLSELRFRVSVIFPSLIAECHYAVNSTVYDVFDLHGTGFGSLQFEDVLMRTSVNMESSNASLRIISADPPYVDFARSMITLKGSDGRVSSALSTHTNELSPILFWMLADQVVDEMDSFVGNSLNDAIKEFKLPANFKPVVTWLMKRQHSPMNPILKRLFPVSSLGSFGNLYHTISGLKHQFNIPTVFESLRSNFRSNLRRFL